MERTDFTFYNHKVGDGLHYITDNFRTFPNGTFQLGDTSEGCVLLNLELVTAAYNLPGVNELWTRVYPNDPMAIEDLAYIISTSVDFTDRFDPHDTAVLGLVMQDLNNIGCQDLANYVTELLHEQGVVF